MNWGWKITIIMTAFIAFILSMVISSFGNKIDLVSADYYQKELVFQEVIDAKTNALSIKSEVNVKHTESGLELSFPDTFTKQITEGTITFFRPDNSDLDTEEILSLVDNKQILSFKKLKPGFYNIYIAFKAGGDDYHIEKSIHL
jgi:nitrogen fixation protein FixH